MCPPLDPARSQVTPVNIPKTNLTTQVSSVLFPSDFPSKAFRSSSLACEQHVLFAASFGIKNKWEYGKVKKENLLSMIHSALSTITIATKSTQFY